MKTRLFVKTGILLSLIALAAGIPAAAEVIAIKSGSFVIADLDNSFTLSGTQDFRATGSVSTASKMYDAIELCKLPDQCAPGTVVDLEGSWSGGDIFGRAHLRGVDYGCIGCAGGDVGARIAFSGSVTLPPMADGSTTVSVPFDFGGHFSWGGNTSRPRSAPFTGGGTATVTLVPNPESGGQTWMIQQVAFEFSEVEKR